MKPTPTLVAVALVGATALLWLRRTAPSEEPPAKGTGAGVAQLTGAALDHARSGQSLFEPTAEDLAELLVDTELGTVEVLVVDGRSPVRGAAVALDRRAETTDARGIASFEGVPQGSHDVSVRHAPYTPQTIAVEHTREHHRRVVAVFGGSALRGGAWDAGGAPLAGRAIVAEADVPADTGQRLRVATSTAHDGSYLLDGLSSGLYTVTRGGSGEHSAVDVPLAPGDEREADFGQPSWLPRWSGTVRDTRGNAVRGPGWIETECRESGALGGFAYDELGNFTASLLPGTYFARMRTWVGRQTLVIAKIDSDCAVDPIVPGAHVTLRLSYTGTRADERNVTARVRVWLYAEPDGEGQRAHARSWADRVFLGVPPGDYSVVCWPNPVDGTSDGRLAITIEAGRPSVVVGVAVGDA